MDSSDTTPMDTTDPIHDTSSDETEPISPVTFPIDSPDESDTDWEYHNPQPKFDFAISHLQTLLRTVMTLVIDLRGSVYQIKDISNKNQNALNHCTELVNRLSFRCNLANRTSPTSTSARLTQSSTSSRQTRTKCKICQRAEHANTACRARSCYECGKSGHFRRDCPDLTPRLQRRHLARLV